MASRILGLTFCALLAASLWAAPVTSADNAEDAMPVTGLYQTIVSQTGWLNTSRPLEAKDLQGRVLLLDFWTFCCINCMHVIPDLQYLEEKFGKDLTVIGVHSAKFENERDSENIRQAILRYGIHHAVVNDFDFSIWKQFGVRSWPTFVLVSPKGIVENTYSGEGHRAELERDIETLRQQYAGGMNTAPLPIALEKDKQPETILKFPGKFTPGVWEDKQVFFIADSGHQQIAVMTPEGGIVATIGSGRAGLKDGGFAEAQFSGPQGVLFKDGWLYIADTNNHALRVADLKAKTVSTLAGTGKQGYERKAQDAPALETPLASPWDLAFYPDDRHIVIAMAGTHQLWSYDIGKKTVSVLAGNGRESIDDGTYPGNSLSQPSGLSARGEKLYFVDAETSSLRVLENGAITTLIGSGLFDFGFKDGLKHEAMMQHPLGVFADEKSVYVADAYNHAVRRFDPEKGRLHTYAGNGKRGNRDGQPLKAEFNEPNDIEKIGNIVYVLDTNNHAVRTIDMTTGTVATLSVMHGKTQAKAAPEEQLPNLESLAPVHLAADTPVTLVIQLKEGWHINDDAPSQLTLFDMNGRPKEMARFDRAALKKKEVTLPKLTLGSYRLQGTFYYCEDKAGSQCLIKSFDIRMGATAKGQSKMLLTLN